jgi:hypothetical protein
MRISRDIFVAGALLVASAQVGAAEEKPKGPPPIVAPTQEICAVLYGTQGSKEMASVHVLDLADGAPFTLPKDAPAGVHTIVCKRDSILPSRNDFRVLLAGVVFVISSDQRIGAVERANGVYRYRMMSDGLTEMEQTVVDKFLSESKRKTDAEAGAAK